jgi:hypothetical protein
VLESFRYATFAGREGERFFIHLGEETTLSAELVQATDWTPPAPRDDAPDGQDRGEAFSIVFRLPLTPMLPQGTYTFQHEEIGTFPLFIVPIGRSAEGLQYEAIFNRPPR